MPKQDSPSGAKSHASRIGDLSSIVEQGNDNAMTGHDRAEILAMKDNQIADLKAQLEKAERRETTLIDEKAKLLELLSAGKEEKRAPMPLREKKEIAELAAPACRRAITPLPIFRLSDTLFISVLGGTATIRVPLRSVTLPTVAEG